METRIRIATPFGTDFQIVPHFLSAQPVWPFRDKATMSLHYPRAGVNDALLNSECEAVFEYHDGTQWVEPLDSRYKLAGRDNDRLEDVPTRRFDFIALLPEMLEHAKVWEPAGLQTDTDGNILFAAVTPGVIIKTLFDNARGRGWGPQLNLGFSTTHDSNGQPWAGVVNLALDPAQSIFEVLSALGNQGIVDWAGQGRTLQMYNPDTYLGRDLQSVRLLAYDGETSAPTQVSYRDRATVLRVVGDGGNTWDRVNGTSPWGRLESIMSAGGVSDEGTAFLMSDEELLKSSAARVSRTREFDGVSSFLPHRDFRGGDHVRYQTENGVEKMRVFSMSLTIEERLSGYAVLGDRFEDALIAAARKQQRITVGKVNGGNGKPPTQPTDDVRTPSNPLGFIMSSSVYLDPEDGTEVGRVHAGWTHTGKGTDGTAMDIDRFEFRIRESLDTSGKWQSFRSVEGSDRDATFSPVRVRREDGAAETYDFQIRAVGANSRYSAWVTYRYLTMETDTTPPPVPSAPVGEAVYGAVSIQWDGFGAGGELMPPDFLHTEAEIGTSPEGPWQFAGNMERAGNMFVPFALEYGTYWLRLRSVDRSANKSEWSALAEVTTTPLVELPDIADLIDDVNTQIEGVRQSANGANTRTDAITDPVTNGTEQEGDSWFKWTEGEHVLDPKILLGQWVWNNGGWQKYEMGHQIIATVDIGKGVIGMLDGIHIKSRTLHIGDQIIVADMNNLATINAQLGVNVTYPASWTTEAIEGYTYKAPGGSDYLMFMDRGGPVPVETGDWLRVSFTAKSGVSGTAQLRAWFYANEDGTGGTVSSTAHTVDFASGEKAYAFDVQVPNLSSIGGGKSWVMGLFGADSRWLGVRNVRVYKKVNATLIGPNSITTPMLQSNIVKTEHLQANAVEADKLAFGFADGKVITGALMQSLAMPNRGFKIDGLANRMYAWNPLGQRVFMLNGDNGDLVLGKDNAIQIFGSTGDVFLGKTNMIRLYGSDGDVNIGNGKLTVDGSTGNVDMLNARLRAGQVIGSDVQGGSITMTGGTAGSYSIGMRGDSEGGYLAFWIPETDNDSSLGATIRGYTVQSTGYDTHRNGAGEMAFRSPRIGGLAEYRGAMWLQGSRVDNGPFYQPGLLVRGDITFTGSTAIYSRFSLAIDAAPGSVLDVGVNSDGVRSVSIRDRAYTQAANVYVSSTGFIGQTSSASRFKIDQRPAKLSDDLLSIPVKDWIDKTTSEEIEGLRDLGVRTANEQILLDSGVDELRVPGVVAEDVASASGGTRFVTYNKDGEIQGVAYDRLAIAQIAVLNRQLKAERERNDQLEARLARLEKLITE